MDLCIISIIITVVTTIASLFITAYLFKYKWKPEIEKIFETNMKTVTYAVFLRLEMIDSAKLEIYKIIEDNIIFKPKQPYFFYDYNTEKMIGHFLKRIKSQQESLIAYMQKTSVYLTEPQMFAVARYVDTICTFFGKCYIPQNVNDLFAQEIYKDMLAEHRDRAQEIIKTFGKQTHDKFKHQWNKEFNKYNYNL